MGKCRYYHIATVCAYRMGEDGKPIPHKFETGRCAIAPIDPRCECDGDEARCDFYPEIRKEAGREISCATCKHWEHDEECRLRNCHRAFTKDELEDKTFVTDAWEEIE